MSSISDCIIAHLPEFVNSDLNGSGYAEDSRFPLINKTSLKRKKKQPYNCFFLFVWSE